MTGTHEEHGLVGKRIGGYRVTGFIARGGMGEVYRGIQESLDRPVAIKILSPRLSAHTDFRERFEREARVAARLDHPNAVRILDFGHADATYYMVLELIEGENLRDTLQRLREQRRRLRIGRTVEIVEQVGSALTAAHALGFIHRDVKPGNVLLRTSGQPVLADFGVVKDLASSDLTTPGMMLGVPKYKAPEEFNDADAVGPASDQYALAVMTYEMVTGRPPFDAPTVTEMMMKHVSEPVTPPGNVAGGVPPGIDAVLIQALAKRPEDRYPTVSAFTTALRSAIQAPAEPPPQITPVAASSAPETAPPPADAPPVVAREKDGSGLSYIVVFALTALLGFIGILVLINLI